MKNILEIPKEPLEQSHKDIKKWNTNLAFIQYEINFLSKDLLKSCTFTPYTKGLFDTHEELEHKMMTSKTKSNELLALVKHHKNKIAGILECSDAKCDSEYKRRHQEIEEQFEIFELYYQNSKTELMEYAAEILKYKKK